MRLKLLSATAMSALLLTSLPATAQVLGNHDEPSPRPTPSPRPQPRQVTVEQYSDCLVKAAEQTDNVVDGSSPGALNSPDGGPTVQGVFSLFLDQCLTGGVRRIPSPAPSPHNGW
jgi:hypothetical protein